MSLPLFLVALLVEPESKPPEFFHDWRFLLVGLRWWVAEVVGRA